MKLSARNVLTGRIIDIHHGEAACVVKIDTGGTAITSTITTDAMKDLDLKVGDEVSAIIKSSDVLIGK